MAEIHHETSCHAPVGAAFAYLDDYRNVPKWMFGVSRFDPVGQATHGLGAVFDGAFAVRPVKLSARVRITEWEQDRLIVLTSVTGFANSSRWQFSADGPDRSTLHIVFAYELPGGLAGRALAKVLGPVLTLSLRHTDDNLRKQIEAHHAEHR